jgi:hypothetical protein
MSNGLPIAPKSNWIHWVGGLFIGLIVFASVFPEKLWGLHYYHFLSLPQQVTIVLLAVSALLIPFQFNVDNSSSFLAEKTAYWNLLFPVFGSVIYGIIIYYFPVAYDPYGDAVKFEESFSKLAIVNDAVRNNLLGFSLHAWSGEQSILSVISYISNYLQIPIKEAFVLLDLFSAIAFSYIWLWFLKQEVKNKPLQVIIGLIGLFAPFSLNFFGRAEVYAPSLVLILAWSVLALHASRSKNRGWSFGLVFINLLCIKAHPISILLVPSTLALVVIAFKPQLVQRFTWRKVGLLILLPIFVSGAVLYFFVFEDHIDGRSLQQTAMQYDHLFLPLFSPEPPLDNYNLLSWNHILDFLNIVALWSPSMLFIFISVVIGGKPKQILRSPSFIIIGLPFLLIGSLLFMINPLLSMPMDWDLFCFPTPLFMIMTVLIVKQQRASVLNKTFPLAISIAIISSSFIIMHRSIPAIANRLDVIAVHVHATYYEWTMNILERSEVIMNRDEQESASNRERLINRIRPRAKLGVDREFSELLRNQAKFQYQALGDFVTAQSIMDEALIYDGSHGNNFLTLMEMSFISKDFKQAHGYSLKLNELKFPTEEQALKMAIHCALEAGLYQEALQHSNRYLETWQNPVINEVQTELLNGGNPSEVKRLFRASD